ncbi:unnamed protein product, partial [Anisakis simplex]|uniref:Methyltranfer_dom domain-containing protein n=1 Tax=Anisakis simplex TaxID=6269 RepID=A0A0M3JH64_ANISI
MDEKALEEDECHDEGQQAIAAKRRKSDNRDGEEKTGEENEDESSYTGKGTVIVNLGCGIGHIGIHLMVLLRKSRLTTDQKRFLFGCDVKKVVVELAGSNAFENNIIENDYKFVDAKMEDVMPNLKA